MEARRLAVTREVLLLASASLCGVCIVLLAWLAGDARGYKRGLEKASKRVPPYSWRYVHGLAAPADMTDEQVASAAANIMRDRERPSSSG